MVGFEIEKISYGLLVRNLTCANGGLDA